VLAAGAQAGLLGAASAAAGAGTAERTFFLFNNCHGGQSAENARRMGELALRYARLGVTPPAAPAVPVQRGLFDDAPTGK